MLSYIRDFFRVLKTKPNDGEALQYHLTRERLRSLRSGYNEQNRIINRLKASLNELERLEGVQIARKKSGKLAAGLFARHFRNGETPPIVLIASGGSSGSHLLARLVARYAPFVTGPEANFASRPGLFSSETYHQCLFNGLVEPTPYFEPRRLSNGNYHHIVPPKFLSNAEAYLADNTAAKLRLLRETDNWFDMIRAVRDHLADAGVIPTNGVMVEHSPGTAFSLPEAFESYPELKAVHIVRDPRDAISSMMSRRHTASIYEGIDFEENLEITAEQWALLTARALRAEGNPGYLRIAYEDLVMRPNEVLAGVMTHLGYPEMREWDGSVGLTAAMWHQKGWINSPTGDINTTSIGRHKKYFSNDQLELLQDLKFEWPDIGIKVDMKELLERFSCDRDTAN